MMFVCCSFTARKGLNILIYWIIVRVLSSSRPYQALTFKTKANKQIQIKRQNFHFHLSHLIPSNSAENWYLGQPRQSTAHKSLKIWQNSNENFHFHPNNLLLVQLTASAHKLIDKLMILYENKRIVKNLQPPSSPRLLHPGFSPPSSPLLSCRMALGRGDLQSGHLVAPPPHVSHSVHSYSSHLVPPVHQYGPLKVGDIDPLLKLPVQGVG